MVRRWRHAWWLAGVAWLMVGGSALDAQSRRRPPTRYLDINPPDQAEGMRMLEAMRDLSTEGILPFQEFELRVLPRQASERRLNGRWFADRNDRGPVVRIEVSPGASDARTLIVQNGPEPSVWSLAEDQPAVVLDGHAMMAPLAGTNLSAADLVLPFLYWREFVYEGRESFRGRPAFVFLLYPPAVEAADYPDIGGVRLYLDTQFRVPLQVQWVDDAGHALKTVSVIDLKKIDERWILKSFEARDERTRDKTRFTVTAVAFAADFPAELFSPKGSGGPATFTVPPEQVTAVQ